MEIGDLCILNGNRVIVGRILYINKFNLFRVKIVLTDSFYYDLGQVAWFNEKYLQKL